MAKKNKQYKRLLRKEQAKYLLEDTKSKNEESDGDVDVEGLELGEQDLKEIMNLKFLLKENAFAASSMQKRGSDILSARAAQKAASMQLEQKNEQKEKDFKVKAKVEDDQVNFEENYLNRAAVRDELISANASNPSCVGKSLLPTKNLDGKLIYNRNPFSSSSDLLKIKIAVMKEKENAENDMMTKQQADLKEPVAAQKQTSSDNLKKRTTSTNEIMEDIARVSSLILEDPERHLSEIMTLFSILAQCKENNRSSDCKLLILSMATIFIDIIPGYRIVKIENEDKSQISKDVRKLRDFEDKLLSSYQHYLSQLEKFANQNKDPSLKHSSLYCMSKMLNSHVHFNYSMNIMTVVVENMNCQVNLETAHLCCDAIAKIFKDDESGSASLECVKLISDMIYARKFNVLPLVVDTLQHLRLQRELPSSKADNQSLNEKKRKSPSDGGKRQHTTKKMKKVNKHLAQVMQEVKEAEAVYTIEQKQQVHSQTLHHLFLTLFRILKKTQPTNPLIPSILVLLSQYAHLISVDYFTDLIKILKELCRILEASGEGFITILHAVTTAFTMLENVGHALVSTTSMGNQILDLRDFYQILYKVIGNIVFKCGWVEIPGQVLSASSNFARKTEIDLICRAFQLMLKKKHQLNVERLCSFVKRLFTVCLSSPSSAALLMLPQLDHPYIRKTPKISSLFDGVDGEERGGVNGGSYDGYMEDPDMTRVFSTCFWELAALHNHYHPFVQSQVKSILSSKPKQNQRASRKEACSLGSLFGQDGGFRLAPKVEIPSEIRSKLSRKVAVGTRGLDGPTALYPSTFLDSLFANI